MRMAAVIEIKDGSCVEMCTPLPDANEPKESPVFTLMGNQWNIRFIYVLVSGRYYYKAYINPKIFKSEFKPFHLEYSIGFKNEENVSLGSGKKKIYTSRNSFCFWYVKVNNLRPKSPLDFEAGNFIKFVLKFYFSKEPTFQLSCMLRDKCVQTTSYANSTCLSSLCQDFSMMLESGLYHDVEIRCENQAIKAHRSILSARSEVFKAMLQSNMREGRTGIVNIQDIDVNCIQYFVKYLYTDTLPELTFDNAKVLYEIGDKYAVRSLMVRCLEYLEDNLCQENACECLALAEAHHDKKLKDKVVAYILKTKLFLQDEFWSPLCEQYPKIALDVYKLSYKNASNN